MSVTAMFAAAGAAGSAVGDGVSAIVMAGLDKIMRNRAGLALSKGNITIGITIAGDFKASYKIKTGKDLDALPSLLAIIPATFNKNGKPYAMGDAVI